MINNYVVLDLETTGLSAKKNEIIEIGAVKIKDGTLDGEFSELINPGIKIPDLITEVTGITDEMVEGKRKIEDVLPEFLEFCDTEVIIGHNLIFDYSFLATGAVNMNLKFEKSGIDTLKIAKRHLKVLPSRKLDYLCRFFHIEDKEHHRAFNDAQATWNLYLELAKEFETPNDPVFKPDKMVYNAKKRQQITEKQKVYLIDLIKYHRIDFESDINTMTKNEASRLIDKILSTYGRIF